MDNYIHLKVFAEIIFPNLHRNSSHTLLGKWSLMHAGIKLNPCEYNIAPVDCRINNVIRGPTLTALVT